MVFRRWFFGYILTKYRYYNLCLWFKFCWPSEQKNMRVGSVDHELELLSFACKNSKRNSNSHKKFFNFWNQCDGFELPSLHIVNFLPSSETIDWDFLDFFLMYFWYYWGDAMFAPKIPSLPMFHNLLNSRTIEGFVKCICWFLINVPKFLGLLKW